MILRTNLPEDSPPPDYVEVERGRTLHRKDSNSSLLSERLSEAGRKHIEESRSRSVTPNPSLSRGQSLFRPESSYYTPSPGDDLSTAEESFDPRAIRRCVEQLQECWPEHAQEIDLLYQDEREGPVLPSAQNLAIGFAAELGPIKCTRNHPSKEETCGKLFDRLINLAHHNETVHKHMWTCPLCPTKTIYRNHLFLVFHLESWHHQPNPYILMWYGDPGIEFSDNIWLNLDLQVHHPLDKSSKEGDIQRGETSTNPDAQFEHGAESTQSRTDSSSPPIDPSTNGVDSTKHNGVGSRIETAEFAAAVAEKLQSQNNLLPSEVALSSFLFFEIPPFVSSSMISTIKEMDSSDKATTCKVCNKFRGRPSEVRKHMRRHERPYRCTFLVCSRAFGSKYDWKRHEQSQHDPPWIYDCIHCLSSKAPEKPPDLFANRGGCRVHLRTYHSSEAESLFQTLEKCLYGENGRSRAFYCGFCVKTVFVTFEARKAISERFDHITHHFINQGASIKDWVAKSRLERLTFPLPSPPSS